MSDRHLGCLLGLAVGDALGTTLEFTERGSFTPITDMIGGGPFRLAPGQWTDDTSMALCLASSLVECGRFDPADQMRRYVRWRRQGYMSSRPGVCFDIGNAVAAALSRFEQTGEPFSGSTDPRSAGNGSLMRLAPIPMFFGTEAAAAMRQAADSSRTTHAAEEAVSACRYFSVLLAGALGGASREELTSPLFAPPGVDWDNEPLAPRVREVAVGSYKGRDPDTIRASGYVVHTLEAALWAFHRSSSFAEGALLAVNLGEDADTTGAVYGQLAGAFYGASGIPSRWREQLYDRELIEGLALRLLKGGPAEGEGTS